MRFRINRVASTRLRGMQCRTNLCQIDEGMSSEYRTDGLKFLLMEISMFIIWLLARHLVGGFR